jgi:hypothetical protein
MKRKVTISVIVVAVLVALIYLALNADLHGILQHIHGN